VNIFNLEIFKKLLLYLIFHLNSLIEKPYNKADIGGKNKIGQFWSRISCVLLELGTSESQDNTHTPNNNKVFLTPAKLQGLRTLVGDP